MFERMKESPHVVIPGLRRTKLLRNDCFVKALDESAGTSDLKPKHAMQNHRAVVLAQRDLISAEKQTAIMNRLVRRAGFDHANQRTITVNILDCILPGRRKRLDTTLREHGSRGDAVIGINTRRMHAYALHPVEHEAHTVRLGGSSIFGEPITAKKPWYATFFELIIGFGVKKIVVYPARKEPRKTK